MNPIRNLRAVRPLLPLIPALGVLIGCGGGEDGFTAEQFVDAMNERGASLELGAELPSTRADAEVYAIELVGPAAEEGAGADAPSHAGGSLTVMPDADAGFNEWQRCNAAASLLCYRADNAVLVLEGEIDPRQMEALDEALRTIEAETGG